MARWNMQRAMVPKFSSESEEAVWWDAHRSEIEAEIRQRIEGHQLEQMAEDVAAETSERAAKMNSEQRAQADSETKRIANQVQRRTR